LLLRLEPAEAELLALLFDELDELLDDDTADDAVLQRLNPPAYRDDAAAEAEFRALTASGLQAERAQRTAACRAELARSTDVELTDAEAGRRWIQVLNDLRLALGTRLGVTEDDDHGIDPSAPDAAQREIYYWLTAVQDSVVRGLMG